MPQLETSTATEDTETVLLARVYQLILSWKKQSKGVPPLNSCLSDLVNDEFPSPAEPVSFGHEEPSQAESP